MALAFTEAEFRHRISRTREALERAGVAGCICVSPENLFYLGGYDAHTHFSEQALVYTTGMDEPTLIIREIDVPSAKETSWLRDVRTYHFGSDEPANVVASVAREKKLVGHHIGMDLQSYALTASYYRRLLDALGTTTRVEDATRVLGRLRVLKSDAEIQYVRQAAAYTQAGIRRALSVIKEGLSETELAGEIEHDLRRHGSDYPAMPTWISSGPRTLVGHATPTDRVIRRGEPVGFSFAGVARRYHVSVYHSVHLGRPSSRYREAYDAAQEALRAEVAAIAVGAPVSAAALAARRSLERKALDKYSKVRWGYGVGIAYPPSWLEPLDIIEESKEVFSAGMVFCLHVPMQVPEEVFGLNIGGDYLLTNKGLEALDTTGGSPEQRSLAVL
jgi:Xaa-Pro dipeptidase